LILGYRSDSHRKNFGTPILLLSNSSGKSLFWLVGWIFRLLFQIFVIQTRDDKQLGSGNI
jgi:hypothetical protein